LLSGKTPSYTRTVRPKRGARRVQRRTIASATSLLLSILSIPAASASSQRQEAVSLAATTDNYAFGYTGITVAPTESSKSVAFGDVTGDSIGDAVLVTHGSPADHLWVFPGTGSGLGPAVSYNLDQDPSPYSEELALGDLDGDGDLDAAVAQEAGVDVLLQEGGTFGSPALIGPPLSSKLAIANLTDAVGSEIVVMQHSSGGPTADGDLILMEQSPLGTWSQTVLAPDTNYIRVFAANLGDDDLDDFIVTMVPGFDIYRNEGDGTFSVHSYDEPSLVDDIGIGDVTNDGLPDVAAGNGGYQAYVYPGKPNGTLENSDTVDVFSSQLAIADFDRNGHNELVGTMSTGYTQAELQHYNASGDPTDVCRSNSDPSLLGFDLAVGDVDGDGKDDMIFASSSGPNLLVSSRVTNAPSYFYTVYGPASVPFSFGAQFTGTMQPANECPELDNSTVTVGLSRSIDGGPSEIVDEDKLNAGGDFVLNDKPPQLGDYTYTIHWDGDAVHAPADSDPISVEVTAGYPVLKPHLDRTVKYGGTGTYVVKLLAYAITTNREVSLYLTPANGAEELLTTAEVSAVTGKLSGSVKGLKVNSTLRVTWAGDADFPAEEWSDEFGVGALVKGTLRKYYDKQGKYYLYKPGKNIFFDSKVTPKKPNDYLTIALERFRDGEWRHFADEKFLMDVNSKLTIYILGGALNPKFRYRIQAAWSGDDTNNSSDSPWRYFRIE
jgi:hypothetical protein